MTDWQDRFVKREYADPADLLASPWNYKIHTTYQQAVVKGSLTELGWVDEVRVNINTNHVFDGNARIIIAIREHQTRVPVAYYDLTEEEEKKALAYLDPSAGLAVYAQEQTDALLRDITTGDENLQKMLAEIAEKAGLYLDAEKPDDPGAQIDKADFLREKWGVQLGQLWGMNPYTICPKCGKRHDL